MSAWEARLGLARTHCAACACRADNALIQRTKKAREVQHSLICMGTATAGLRCRGALYAKVARRACLACSAAAGGAKLALGAELA